MSLNACVLENASRRFVVLFRAEPQGVLQTEIVASIEVSGAARHFE